MGLMWPLHRDTCVAVYSNWDTDADRQTTSAMEVDRQTTSAMEVDPLILKVQFYNGVALTVQCL